jgi:hypothetical protein
MRNVTGSRKPCSEARVAHPCDPVGGAGHGHDPHARDAHVYAMWVHVVHHVGLLHLGALLHLKRVPVRWGHWARVHRLQHFQTLWRWQALV